MSDSPNLALPFLAASQAQKHVTVNEALRVLDGAVHLAVLDRDLAGPPGSPADGQRWIVAGSGTGDWAGQGGRVALREDGAWRFLVPKTGWICFVIDESALVHWTGSAWAGLGTALAELQNVERLGLGTTADAANPLSAKLNNLLLAARTVAEGGDGDLRCKFSKQTTADVLSLLMQTGYSGRAELGLVGDDDLVAKLSADGSSWTEALRLTANGRAGIGTASPSYRLHVAGTLGFAPGASVTPANDGDVVFELTSNTSLAVRAKGSDGVVRSAVLTLA